MKKTIIPIASGKGGVGKTIVAANLAIALAGRGHSTIAADLDLGGSNLYTCLGIPNRYPGIGDYLRTKDVHLKDLTIPTHFPNLKFLPGDGRMPFMANIAGNQMTRLVKELTNLPAEYIILDLGAGTIFNTLIFYGLARKGMIVTSFETPSIMNFVMFLRNFIFRVIASHVRHDQKTLKVLGEAFRQPMTAEPLTVTTLISKIAQINPELGQRAQSVCDSYHPRIIFNMGTDAEELIIMDKLYPTLKQGLSLDVDCFGWIPYDDAIRQSAKKREVLLAKYPKSIASQSLKDIADRIITGWDAPVERSVPKLIADTRKRFNQWKSQ